MFHRRLRARRRRGRRPTFAFGDAPLPMFDNPPKCWLHRQANFINGFFPDGTEPGVDYDWFPLPPIDKDGTLFGGELTVVGTQRQRGRRSWTS